jgi:hypothetical protein
MKRVHHSFAEVRDAIFAPPPQRRARGGRTGMVVAGNRDVIREAQGDESYAKGNLRDGAKRRAATGRTKKPKSLGAMSGGPVKHRADRPSRRKLASGGTPGGALMAGFPGAGIFPVIPITGGSGAPKGVPIPPDTSPQQMAQFSNAIASFSKQGQNNQKNSQPSNNQPPVDLGRAVYSDGTPIGIMGVAPFAGSPDDISANGGQKRGGRVREARRPKTRDTRSAITS